MYIYLRGKPPIRIWFAFAIFILFWVLLGLFVELGRSHFSDSVYQQQVFEIFAPLWPAMETPREK